MFSKIAVCTITFYQKYISFLFVYLFGGSCRFTPTCSEYTKNAIQKYGALKGLNLGIVRIIRCNPFTKVSFDPVP